MILYILLKSTITEGWRRQNECDNDVKGIYFSEKEIYTRMLSLYLDEVCCFDIDYQKEIVKSFKNSNFVEWCKDYYEILFNDDLDLDLSKETKKLCAKYNIEYEEDVEPDIDYIINCMISKLSIDILKEYYLCVHNYFKDIHGNHEEINYLIYIK